MSSTNISQTRFEPTIQTFEKMNNSELEWMQKTVSHVLAGRKLHVLPKRESELLLQINEPALTLIEQKRFDLLDKKFFDEKISKKQHAEMMDLIVKMERHDVQRLKNLIELSQIRKVSLDELMQQLGISKVSKNG